MPGLPNKRTRTGVWSELQAAGHQLGQVLDQAEIEYGLKGAHNGKQANFIINARGFQRADGTFSGTINLMNIDARNSRGISQRLFKAPGCATSRTAE